MRQIKLKLHLILVIIGTLSLFSPKEILADCGWGGPFLDNLERPELADILIIRGKILAYHKITSLSSPPPSLEIEVLDVYRGTFDNSKIRISSDILGASLTDFPVGTEWVLALQKQPNGEYTISGCWSSYLKVETLVVGNLNTTKHEEKQRISLDEFKNLLQGETPLLINDYEEGIQAGLRQCAWHGSGPTKYGRLYIPMVDVPEVSGNIITYEVRLNQIEPSFVFELDLNSLKIHQQ